VPATGGDRKDYDWSISTQAVRNGHAPAGQD